MYKLRAHDFSDPGGMARVRASDLEKARVFHEICRVPGTTRSDVIRELELRPTSVSNAVKSLIEGGLVFEERVEGSGRQGRPFANLAPSRNRFTAMAVHCVSKTLHASLVNGFGEILLGRQTVIEEKDDAAALVAKLGGLAAALQAGVPPGSEFLGTGLSLPGFIDTSRRRWIMAARWPCLRDLAFSRIEKAVGSPILVTRALDAGLENLLAGSPSLRGSDVLLIHWGYGIGAAHAANGRVLSSSVGGVCEIGHSRLASDAGRPCRCGSIGCLETQAALWSILPALRRDFPEVPEDEAQFKHYLAVHASLADHPVVRSAVSAMARGIGLLYVTLFPRRILLYGPLASHSRIRSELGRLALEQAPEFSRAYFSLRFIDPGFHGELFGGTRAFFRAAYREALNVTG